MPRKQPSPKTHSQLRIIGGQWRGRKLAIADVAGLRPTGDRIRETLFNWLQLDIQGANCLDCFAGSGALGLEALSRGAATAHLIEKSPTAAQQLRAHLSTLRGNDETGGEIIEADALQWLQQAPLKKQSIDIVFIDPPFAGKLWDGAIQALVDSDCLAEDAAIYIETPKSHPLTAPQEWTLHREKHAGDVCYRLFRYNKT